MDRWAFKVDGVGGIMLHRMNEPDPGIDLHDHPWWFMSIVLKGSYDEERAYVKNAVEFARIDSDLFSLSRYARRARGLPRHRPRWSVRTTSLKWCHRIVAIHKPTWTLVITGPKRKDRRPEPEWGFYTPEGYVDQETYHARLDEEYQHQMAAP